MTKQSELDAAEDDVQTALVAARTADPTSDGLADADVVTKTGVRDGKVGPRDGAFTAYDGVRDTLEAWDEMVPDRAWQKLLSFFEAQATLAELKNLPATSTLVGDLETAEDEWVTALKAAAVADRAAWFLQDTTAAEETRLTRFEAARGGRLLSGVRGDF